MSASVRIISQTSIINLEGHPFDHLVQTIQGKFDGAVLFFSSAHPFGKALQAIVVSCYRRKVAEALIPIDAEWGSERRRLDLVLAPTNPERIF